MRTFNGYRWDGTVLTVRNNPNRADFYNSDGLYKNITNYLKYKKTFAEAHNVNATLGTAYENQKFSNFSAWFKDHLKSLYHLDF